MTNDLPHNDTVTSLRSAESVSVIKNRDEINVADFVRRRRYWPIVGILVGILAGLVYAFFGRPTFEASGEIMVIQKSAHLPARGSTSPNEVEKPVTEGLLATHVEILKSKRIVSSALKSLDRADYTAIEASIDLARRNYENDVEYIIRKLVVERGGVEQNDLSANTLRITFEHTSAEHSRKILDALVKSYCAFVAETFHDVSREAVVLIDKAKTDFEQDLQRIESKYVDFLKAAPLLWSGEVDANGQKRQNIPQRRVDRVEQQLTEIKVLRTDTDARLDEFERLLAVDQKVAKDGYGLALPKEEDLKRLNFFAFVKTGNAGVSEAFQISQASRVQAIRADYEDRLNVILNDLAASVKLGKDHPKRIELESKKAGVEDFLQHHLPDDKRDTRDTTAPAEVLQAYLTMLRHDAAELKAREAALEAFSKAETLSAKEIIGFEVRAEMLRQEMDRKRKLLDAIVDRLREINLINEYGGFLTEVITPVADGKLQWLGLIEVSPWMSMVLSCLAGGFLGCCVGGMGGIVRHLFDDTFASDDEIERDMGLPILSRIDLDAAKSQAPIGAEDDAKKVALSLASVAECRELRDAISLLKLRRGVKALQITSPADNNASSWLVANLAAACARAGMKTLIVDCDFRSGFQSRFFGLGQRPGISDLIDNPIRQDEVVHPTDLTNLQVLPVGRSAEKACESVVSREFADMMRQLRDQYDLILLDAPGVLGGGESLAAAGHADAALLAMRVERGGRHQTIQARDRLAELGVTLLGIVITGADDKSRTGYRGFVPIQQSADRFVFAANA